MRQNPLGLGFLWHMHQPDYRDSQGVMQMPWVFLHAIKDYYDMPWNLSQFPTLKATFNLTAPLIEQLKLYCEPLKYDYFLQLYAQDPASLTPHERQWLIKICRSSNYEMMVKPSARYSLLYAKEALTTEEIIELEVLFLLAWCGGFLRTQKPLIMRLIAKQSGYSAEDKRELLTLLTDFVATILPFYASLLKLERISLTTTPYNHPILPLLLNMHNAVNANTQTAIPSNTFALEADAKEQVKRAILLYEETFGVKPKGMWPAEGAVDEASVAIYREMGIEWIATDEAILFGSLGEDTRHKLYHPYQFEGLKLYFRDHRISDLFGFDYRFKPTGEAVDSFIQELTTLSGSGKDQTLFVILDGENAWEYYEQNATPFFRTLYRALEQLPWCQTLRLDEITIAQTLPLTQLSAGSWIGGDFSTWSGHPEKNRAWELIFETQRTFQRIDRPLTPHLLEEVRHHLLAAECSDWFWWYGDDHSSDFAQEFDQLFREHLIRVYQLLECRVPAVLYQPIIQTTTVASAVVEPVGEIHPKIDGKQSSYFEWMGCGTIDESRLFSTMDRVRGPLHTIRFGQNATEVYLAFEGEIATLCEGVLRLIFVDSGEVIELPLEGCAIDSEVTIAVGEMIEVALPKTILPNPDHLRLRFELIESGRLRQALPGVGLLELALDGCYSRFWFV